MFLIMASMMLAQPAGDARQCVTVAPAPAQGRTARVTWRLTCDYSVRVLYANRGIDPRSTCRDYNTQYGATLDHLGGNAGSMTIAAWTEICSVRRLTQAESRERRESLQRQAEDDDDW